MRRCKRPWRSSSRQRPLLRDGSRILVCREACSREWCRGEIRERGCIFRGVDLARRTCAPARPAWRIFRSLEIRFRCLRIGSNAMSQSLAHDNLFIVGAGTFPTGDTANPTLKALALRAAVASGKLVAQRILIHVGKPLPFSNPRSLRSRLRTLREVATPARSGASIPSLLAPTTCV